MSVSITIPVSTEVSSREIGGGGAESRFARVNNDPELIKMNLFTCLQLLKWFHYHHS